MGKKLTIEFVKESFEKEDYTLLNTKYINSKQKLDYICSEGHRYSITWSDWNSGNRCPYCARLKKKTVSFIKSEFEKEGYTLLSTEYVNAFQKLEYTCPEGHKHTISWDRWNTGNRCPYCYGNKKLTTSSSDDPHHMFYVENPPSPTSFLEYNSNSLLKKAPPYLLQQYNILL